MVLPLVVSSSRLREKIWTAKLAAKNKNEQNKLATPRQISNGPFLNSLLVTQKQAAKRKLSKNKLPNPTSNVKYQMVHP